MPHVSRNPLNKDVYIRIIDALYWLLADLKTTGEMKQFLGDFFTRTERIMLAKRLALAGMILQGYSDDIIHKVLKVSTATIYRMRETLQRSSPGLQAGFRRLLRKEFLEDLLHKLSIPPDNAGFHPLSDT